MIFEHKKPRPGERLSADGTMAFLRGYPSFLLTQLVKQPAEGIVVQIFYLPSSVRPCLFLCLIRFLLRCRAACRTCGLSGSLNAFCFGLWAVILPEIPGNVYFL